MNCRNILKTAAMLLLLSSIHALAQTTKHLTIHTVNASEFKVVGPGGGGSMFRPAISPHNPSEVLVSCDMTGSYITHDAGRSWRMFNLRGGTRFFTFDPLRPQVIYAGTTSALWRSINNGSTWNLFWPKPSSVIGVRMNPDHANETILFNANPLGVIVALAVDPADSRILIAAAVKEKAAAVYISKNDGRDWEKAADLPEIPKTVFPAGFLENHTKDWFEENPEGFMEKIWIDPHSARVTGTYTLPAFRESWCGILASGNISQLLKGLPSPISARASPLRMASGCMPPLTREFLSLMMAPQPGSLPHCPARAR